MHLYCLVSAALAIVRMVQPAAAVDMPADPAKHFATSDGHVTLAPPTNLHPSVIASGIPIPTNAWWGNLIATGQKASPAVWTHPYAVTMRRHGVQVSYPAATRKFGTASGNRHDAKRSYEHTIRNDMTLAAVEWGKSSKSHVFHVTKWDELSVTVQHSSSTGVGGLTSSTSTMESTFTSGMAFTSTQYTNLTPHIVTEHEILTVNTKALGNGQTITDTKFVLNMTSGDTWVLYTSEALTFTVGTGSSLQSTTVFTGSLHVALAKSPADIAVYDTHVGCTVQGGTTTQGTNDYSFKWTTQGTCTAGLLHFGLAHHAETVDTKTAAVVSGMSHLESTTRGAMVPLVALPSSSSFIQWKLLEPTLVPAGMFPRQRPSADRVVKTNLLKHLTTDINTPWPSLPLDGSYYFNGKTAQKYASLCLMASDPAIVGPNNTSLLETCRTKLETLLQPFLHNKWRHKLVYDTVYKGIVSSEGFDKKDMNADFGNTMYNDHHYHFGYWIAATAITNVVHPTMPGLASLNARASFLIRDVANDNALDAAFPRFR
ncbi:hypothetical protein As57867_009595, partial [Aphanomyces stellatus]